MTYAILCTQGHMKYTDLHLECKNQKWLPVLVMRTDGKTIIPVFETPNLAIRFIHRNLPKKWLCGFVNLNLRDAQWMDDHGWQAVKFDFPRKLKDAIEFDVEVLEYDPNHVIEIEQKAV